MCDRLPVDALGGLLDGPRARGAFLLRAVFAPPWSMRIEDRAPLTLMALLATARDTDVVMRLDGEKVERLAIFPPHPKRDVPAFDACGLRGSSQSPLLSV